MSKEELADFAPILPQEQFQKNFEENQSREPWNLSDLFALAPFMEEEDVGRFALKFADSGTRLRSLWDWLPSWTRNRSGKS